MISIDSLSTKLDSLKTYVADIKNAIVAKKGSAVEGHIETFASEIIALPSGGETTSLIDLNDTGYDKTIAEELADIGWSSDDIEFYRAHGVTWDIAENPAHHVNSSTKEFYQTYIAGSTALTTAILKAECIKWNWCPQFGTKINIVTNLQGIFSGSPWYGMPSLDFSNVTNVQYAFTRCDKLTCLPRLTFSDTKLKSGGGNSMFDYCSSLAYVEHAYAPPGPAQYMFRNCTSLKEVHEFKFKGSGNCPSIFQNCCNLVSVNFTSDSDWSEASSLTSLYDGCRSLQDAYVYIGPSVAQINMVASGCYSLKSIHFVAASDTPLNECVKLTSATKMFLDCQNLIDIPELPFPKVTTYHSSYFINTSNLNPGLVQLRSMGEVDMSSVTTASGMLILSDATSGTAFVSGKCTGLPNLTNVGGFKGLPLSADFTKMPALTETSVINIISKASDTCTGQTMTFSVPLDTEAIAAAIAAKPNWTITTTYGSTSSSLYDEE